MPVSIKDRLENIMLAKGWTQSELASVMAISQPALSKKIREGKSLSHKHIHLLREATGFNLEWLQNGRGPMGAQMDIVSEPYPEYGQQATNEGMQERFAEAIDLYRDKKGYSTYTEVSEALNVNIHHMNGVRNGHKDVTMTLLTQLVSLGNINANYILCGMKPVFISDGLATGEVLSLRARVEELKRDKENMQLLVDQMNGLKRKTA